MRPDFHEDHGTQASRFRKPEWRPWWAMLPMRAIAIIAIIIAFAVLGVWSYRVDYSSRTHTDTLRHECWITTRIFGFPIARQDGEPWDRFHGAYTAISGREPDPARWRPETTDCVQTMGGAALISCYFIPHGVRERMDLLEALYTRFNNGMPGELAAEYFARIESLTPPAADAEWEIYFQKVKVLRREIALEPLRTGPVQR